LSIQCVVVISDVNKTTVLKTMTRHQLSILTQHQNTTQPTSQSLTTFYGGSVCKNSLHFWISVAGSASVLYCTLFVTCYDWHPGSHCG